MVDLFRALRYVKQVVTTELKVRGVATAKHYEHSLLSEPIKTANKGIGPGND